MFQHKNSRFQAWIQRGGSCSYITAMECKIMTEMSLYRQSNLYRMVVLISRSALDFLERP